MSRREVTIRGATEVTLFVDSSEYIGMSHSQIARQLKSLAEAHSGVVEIDDDDVELAAYQIRGDLA